MSTTQPDDRSAVLFRRDDVELDLSDEIPLHLDMETAELVRRGRTEKEARREARLLLGGVEQTKEAVRGTRPLHWLGGMGLDVRLGLRDIFDRPLARVELAPMTQEPEYRIASRPLDGSLLWQPERTFDFPYRFGRRRYQCSLESQRPLPDSGLIVDPLTARFMQDVFENPGNQGDALKRLLPAPEHTAPTTAGLLERTANKPR